MTFRILANLDQEARWAGQTLPRHVLDHISRASSLLVALAPAGELVEIYAPRQVSAEPVVPQLGSVAMRTGPPPPCDLAWAQLESKAVNDRRFYVETAIANELALPGMTVVSSLAELEAHLAAGGASASAKRAWVCKAPWTCAGRSRSFGTGDVVSADAAASFQRLVAQHGALVFEPWLDRIADYGVVGAVDASGRVDLLPPHGILTTATGTFLGVELVPAAPLEVVEHDMLVIAADRAGIALHHAGYAGPFGIDAFTYRDTGERRFHPMCEINARHTFGHVTHAIGKRLGVTTLGFSDPSGPAVRAWLHAAGAWVA